MYLIAKFVAVALIHVLGSSEGPTPQMASMEPSPPPVSLTSDPCPLPPVPLTPPPKPISRIPCDWNLQPSHPRLAELMHIWDNWPYVCPEGFILSQECWEAKRASMEAALKYEDMAYRMARCRCYNDFQCAADAANLAQCLQETEALYAWFLDSLFCAKWDEREACCISID